MYIIYYEHSVNLIRSLQLVIQYNIPRIDNFTKVDFRYFWLEIILDYNTYEYLISDK